MRRKMHYVIHLAYLWSSIYEQARTQSAELLQTLERGFKYAAHSYQTAQGWPHQYRKEEERYARRVSMDEIEQNDYNLNISRYVSTAEPEPEIDLAAVHAQLVDIEKCISEASDKHNHCLKQLNLPPV